MMTEINNNIQVLNTGGCSRDTTQSYSNQSGMIKIHSADLLQNKTCSAITDSTNLYMKYIGLIYR